MTTEHALPDSALADAFASIAQRLAPGATLVGYRPLQGGVSATVHVLEIANAAGPESVVVRRHGAATWKQLAPEVTQNEYQVLSCLRDAGMLVPRPRLLDGSSEVLPSPFFVMDLVSGTTEISESAVGSALRQMAVFLASLHALDVASLRLPVLPVREDPVQGALEYVSPDAGSARVRQFIASYRVKPVRPSLLHGDFWPGNMVWANERLAAVIDWEDAAIGPAASDVACCRAELNARFDESAARRFTDEYLAASTTGLADLALWDVYVGSAALATLHQWGLPPEVESRRRERTAAFVAQATEALLRGD